MYPGNLDHGVWWWSGFLLVVALTTVGLMGLFLVMVHRSSQATRPADVRRLPDRGPAGTLRTPSEQPSLDRRSA